MKLIIICLSMLSSFVWTSADKIKESLEIKWQKRDDLFWSNNCLFTDNIDSNTIVSAASKQECINECVLSPKCTHFSWYMDTCSHQSGSASKKAIELRANAACGYVENKPRSLRPSRNQQEASMMRAGVSGWRDGYPDVLFQTNCDFFDRDRDSFPTPDFACGPTCFLDPDCTHFAWFDGVCYRKGGRVSLNDAFPKSRVTCGVMKFRYQRSLPTPLDQEDDSDSDPAQPNALSDQIEPCKVTDQFKLVMNTRCAKYFKCVDGKLAKFACPKEQFFDIRTHKCTSDRDFYCIA